jgi:hypothetical protein
VKRLSMIVAALVLLSAADAPMAELGRLFLSPAERDALDRARYAAPVAVAETDIATGDEFGLDEDDSAEPEIRPPEPVVTVDGYVRRSAGPPTVWVNGTDAHQGNLAEQGLDARGLRLEQSRVRVPRRNGETALLLKPGESFDPETAHISDAYQRRPEAPLTR